MRIPAAKGRSEDVPSTRRAARPETYTLSTEPSQKDELREVGDSKHLNRIRNSPAFEKVKWGGLGRPMSSSRPVCKK